MPEERTTIGIGHRVAFSNGHRQALAQRETGRTTGERFMHDPKEEKKGGFGAFVQRDNERREAEALKNAPANGATAPAPTPSAPAGAPSSDASGTT